MSDQQLYKLVQSYYEIAAIETWRELSTNELQLMSNIEQQVQPYYDQYNVDTIGDLEEKLVKALAKTMNNFDS